MCGNFQEKKPTDLLYTANIDISTIRMVLSVAAQHGGWGVRVLDVETAFLRTPMPESEEQEAVYVRPPALLVQFKLIEPYIFWLLKSVVYGLRKGPRL